MCLIKIQIMNQNVDLETLQSQCHELIRFIKEKGSGEFISNLSDIIDQTYSENDKKGLLFIRKDLSEWASGLISGGKEYIHSILSKVEKENDEVINQILERGQIVDDEEYRILLDYVNQKFAIDKERDNIGKANKLLYEYSQLKG